MNGQLRNKARLLARASTLAIIAAAGSLGTAQQAQADCTTTFDPPATAGNVAVPSNYTCVLIDDAVTGDVTNAKVIGDPGAGYVPFWVTDTIGGQLVNNGNISGGYASGLNRGALQISNGGTVSNGLFNNGLITSTSGNGIQIGTGGEGAGQVNGGIWNTNAISSGTGYGIAAIEGGLTGGFHNASGATLNGGLAALYIDDSFTGDWSGGIHNSGQISGVSAGIVMGDGGGSSVDFSGGINNYSGGSIDSVGGTAIRITNDIASFSGGITNSGEISGANSAIVIGAQSFSGGLNNYNLIEGLNGDGVNISSDWSGGDFNNYGVISGSDDGVEMDILFANKFDGNFNNQNRISGGDAGVDIYVSAFQGNITNAGSISGVGNGDNLNGGGLLIYVTSSLAGAGGLGNSQITNTGSITTTYGYGVGITGGEGSSVNADFNNTFADVLNPPTPVIDSDNGTGVYISVQSWNGNITNDGRITGDSAGMRIAMGTYCTSDCTYTHTFAGTITNTGTISGYEGLHVAVADFDGNIINSGMISGTHGAVFTGASTDAYFGNKGAFNGNITNTSSGSIVGVSTGLLVSYDTFTGDITNNGYIEGTGESGVGAFISANTFTGNITNNGQIIGAGEDTGLHIVVNGTMTGDILNNNYIFAVSDALNVDIDNLVGQVVNTGVIESDFGDAVLLNVDNGTTFANNNGGLILGDVNFSGQNPYAFVGGEGGVEGNLNGHDTLGGSGGTNDDTITVQNGDQYFFGGKASNFSTFTVGAGGVAVMGSKGVGSESRSAYSFQNVDNVAVNNNGQLYIDKSTTLNVDNNYTQAAGGTLLFYLGAPGGEGFSSLTGTQVAGPNDYGQLLVGGTVTLNGTIGGFLDPAFGTSANPGLTEVVYNDVIVANGGISGDFTTTALISNNSLFELDSLKDGNTIDLRVLRSSLGSVSAPSNIVNTGDPFDANIAGRASGGGCGVAGFGWCINQYAANEPGATSVMTDASPGEDPFAWLRAGSRRVGETAVWGRAVGVWGQTDGDNLRPGTDFSLGGGIVGIDHVFQPQLLAGVAAQWTTTDIDFDLASGDAQVDSIEVGAYASIGDPHLFVNANVSYIWHDFDVNRVTGPNRANGDYNGNSFSAYVEAGKTFETGDRVRIQPLVALSYAHLDTDAYTETGTGTLLNVSDADLDQLKSMIGARVGYSFTTGAGRSITPEARILWAHEFMDDHSSHLVDPVGGPVVWTLVDGEKFSRDTLVLGAGVTASLSASTTLFVDYDAGINSDITTHTVSAGLRTRW